MFSPVGSSTGRRLQSRQDDELAVVSRREPNEEI